MKSIKIYGITLIISLLLITFFQTSLSQNFNITTLNNPAPGLLNFNTDEFQLIDNYGTNLIPNQPIKNSSLFKRLRNNNWISLVNKKYYVYDEFINLIDSIPNPTNLNIDFHDVTLLSNGHYLLLLNDMKIMDLSEEVEGGKTNAKVIFNVLVETDRTGTIYWRWDIADHVQVSDITESFDLSQTSIDLTHINSIFEDTDGNIIISIRHFDEVAKINKATGNFMWRMGGSKCKNNQFTFTNDTENNFFGFSHQHTVQRLENGNILMFDNGNLKEPQYSRAVEYSIDETQKTATKVWEYRAVPDIYQSLMGSVQRLPNGNTLINWTNNKITEVKPNKTIAFEMTFSNFMIYRASKYVTIMKHVQKEISSNQLYDFSNPNYLSGIQIDVSNRSNNGNVDLQLFDYHPISADFNDNGFTKIYPYRYVLSSDNISSLNGSIYINLNKFSAITNPTKVTIYHRPKETSGTFQALSTTYNAFSNEIVAPFPSFGEFVVVSNKLEMPTLIAPINHQVAQPNGKLEWNSVNGALKYQIQLDSTKEYKKPIFDLTITKDKFFNYTNLKRIDSCYWRVRAINSKDTSAWADNGRFTTLLPKPKLLTPINDSLNFPVNLSLNWLAVEGAESYNIYIAEDNNFTKNIIIKNSVGTSITISNLKNAMKYFWKVQAVRSTDSSYWSESWNFETILPTPIMKYPEHQKQNIEVNPLLSWNYDITSLKFEVEVSLTANFADLIIDTVISDKLFQIQELKSKTQYYWRVRAQGINRFSNWSFGWTFITGNGFDLSKPTLLSPINNSHNFVSGNLKWVKVNNANKYRLQVFQSSNKEKPLIDTLLSKTEFNYKNLTYNSAYVWKVMALSNYSEGKWTDFWEFFTFPKSSIVQLNSPLNDQLQVAVNCKLEWFDISDISYFELQVAEDEQFTKLIASSNSVKVNYYYISNLQLNTKYYWRVRYIEGGVESKWSDVWFFTTESKYRLSNANLIYPNELDIEVQTDCTLKWNQVPGAAYYQIAIASDVDFHQLIYKINKVTDTTFSLANLDYNRRYFWRISSFSDDAQSQWSESNNFLTALKSPIVVSPVSNFESKDSDLTIRWAKTDIDENFTIQIAKNIDFTDGLLDYEVEKADSLLVKLAYSNKYFVRIKSFGDNNNSAWSNVVPFVILSELSIENELLDDLIVYPNPTNDFITVNEMEIGTEFEVYDLNGKIVLFDNYQNIIDVNILPSGQYFIKFNNKILKFCKE